MRCNICDKVLTDVEVQFTPDKKGFEPCSPCMEIIMDAAYSDGFVRPDEADEVPILDELTDDQVVFDFTNSPLTNLNNWAYGSGPNTLSG